MMTYWDDKPYHSLNYTLKEQFGQKVYKLSLNGGFTCPNRDGTLGDRGCIFCSQGGSGDFSAPTQMSISEQIDYGKQLIHQKFQNGKYIAYFQAFTNTYGELSYLESIYTDAINHPDIVALSIATRPDCLSDEILSLLDRLNQIKPVWIELGLQTIHAHTAKLIRRGYELDCFEYAIHRLNQLNITTIVHVILGLPQETHSDMLATTDYLAKLPIQGIKLQLLHILKHTDLATYYQQQPFHILSLEEYSHLIVDIIERLPQHLVIHRITGDGPKDLLIEPRYSAHKRLVLNTIHQTFKARHTFQGKLLSIKGATK